MCRQSNREYAIDLNRNVHSVTDNSEFYAYCQMRMCKASLSLARSPSISLRRSVCSMALHTQFVVVRSNKKRRRWRKVRHLYFHYSIARIFGMFECSRRFRSERESLKCADVFDCADATIIAVVVLTANTNEKGNFGISISLVDR